MTLIGVNAPYLLGEYGHDLAPNGRFPDWPVSFDAMHAYRPIIEAREIGFDAIRIWLCENAEGIVVEDGKITGVHDDLLEAIRIIQEGAALNGVRVYWSLLDGNAVAREGDPITRSILTDADQRSRFADKVVAPIAALIEPGAFALEIINEPETATEECMADAEEKVEGIEPVAWADIGATIRAASQAVDGRHPVTAGTMHIFLPQLWETNPGLSAIDVHVYHPNGGLPSRQDLVTYVGDEAIAKLPLIGGECGIPKDPGPTEPLSLFNYIFNGDALDYAGVFLWQLEGDFVDVKAPKRPFTSTSWALRTLLEQRNH